MNPLKKKNNSLGISWIVTTQMKVLFLNAFFLQDVYFPSFTIIPQQGRENSDLLRTIQWASYLTWDLKLKFPHLKAYYYTIYTMRVPEIFPKPWYFQPSGFLCHEIMCATLRYHVTFFCTYWLMATLQENATMIFCIIKDINTAKNFYVSFATG